jgi:hypothetical protein
MLKEYNSLLMPNQNLSATEIRPFIRHFRWVDAEPVDSLSAGGAGHLMLRSSKRPTHVHRNRVAAGTLILACSPMKRDRAHQGGAWSSLWRGVPPDAEQKGAESLCFGSSARMTLPRVETAGGSWWSASGHEG